MRPIIANISNKHSHLSKEDLKTLFGENAQLTNIRDLMQPGQFACKEQITLVGPKGKIEKVRIVGPVRKQTQVEISYTDSYVLGVSPPVRESGDVAGSAPLTIIGPNGKIDIKEGCIVMKRHVHFTPKDAEEFGIKDKQIVNVRAGIGTERETVFGHVICRVREDMALECHIDSDEANACMLKNGDIVEIIK